jgi:putative glutathione S-transferase
MLNGAFDVLAENDLDLYPEALRQEIDAINDAVYGRVNNGVYKCGFAGTQKA